MGWSLGTRIFSEMIDVIKENVDESTRKVIYEKMIEIFEDIDCDVDHLLGEDEVFDEVWAELCPEEDEEEVFDED